MPYLFGDAMPAGRKTKYNYPMRNVTIRMPAHMTEYAYVKKMYVAELVHTAIDEYIQRNPIKTMLVQEKIVLDDVDDL